MLFPVLACKVVWKDRRRCPLTLTILAGEDIHIAIDPHEHDRLHGFENAVLEQLPYLGSNSTFGCELQFVHKDTHEVLADPIRGTLRVNQCFYVLARQCFVEAATQRAARRGSQSHTCAFLQE